MTNKERLTENLSTRITKSQKEKLDELDVNLREIVDYYIVHNTNPTLKLKNEQKVLLKEIEEMENSLSEKKERLKQVNIELGVPIDENIATIDVVTIAERIKSNCEIKHKGKCNKNTMADFIISGDGKLILKHGIAEFGIKKEEDKRIFMSNVFKYLNISSQIRESDFENVLLQV